MREGAAPQTTWVRVRCVASLAHYSHCVEAQKSRDPQGIPSLNSVVSIADHGHICFVRGSRGPRDHPQKSPLKFYYVNYMGQKVLVMIQLATACRFRGVRNHFLPT